MILTIWKTSSSVQQRFHIGKPCWQRDPKSWPFNSGSFVSCQPKTKFDIHLIQHTVAPIQEASSLGVHFAEIANKLPGTQSRLAQSLYALKKICSSSAWLTCSRYRAHLLVSVNSTRSSQAVTHPSTFLAQCCLTSVNPYFRQTLVCCTTHRGSSALTPSSAFKLRQHLSPSHRHLVYHHTYTWAESVNNAHRK